VDRVRSVDGAQQLKLRLVNTAADLYRVRATINHISNHCHFLIQRIALLLLVITAGHGFNRVEFSLRD
jgi:hypothetical protein